MIRKYHNHKLQTIPWHCEEEPHNNHETPGRQTKQSNQPSQNQLCWLISLIYHIKSTQIGHALEKIDDDYRGRHEGCQTLTEFLLLRQYHKPFYEK